MEFINLPALVVHLIVQDVGLSYVVLSSSHVEVGVVVSSIPAAVDCLLPVMLLTVPMYKMYLQGFGTPSITKCSNLVELRMTYLRGELISSLYTRVARLLGLTPAQYKESVQFPEQNPIFLSRIKHIGVQYYFVLEVVEEVANKLLDNGNCYGVEVGDELWLGQLRDELMSSFREEGVLGQERYSSASTRMRGVYFNSSRNGRGVDLQGHSDAQVRKREHL
ncbi:hypothetical protein PIB30_086879 [Stylosanthes scabra]|uniref:Uncharacterized protein n=1 Tax=Stylosanthes scabra TaxID=79078 RepID=A0ABU6QU20_9FABA|nr:hypothetical protein [Stylosanthes scabra]